MANLSTFPTTLDSFISHTEIQASDVPNVQLYQQLIMTANPTPDQQTQLTNLTNTLRDKLISSDDINKLQDCITNLETFFQNNVDGYITTKQSEFDATVAKLKYIGAYNPTTTYMNMNMVSWTDGQTYMCQADNTVGIDPSHTASWALIAEKGANGAQGAQGAAGANLVAMGNYNPATTYMKDQMVYYNGSAYYCLADNTLGVSPANTSSWQIFVSQGNSTQLVKLSNKVVIPSSQSNVSIGISQFNSSQDALMVFINSTFAYNGTDYTIDPNGTSIDIVGATGATWSMNTEFDFVVFKNVQTSVNYNDGTLLDANSVLNNALAPDCKVGSLSMLETLTKSDAVSAINENNIMMWMGV